VDIKKQEFFLDLTFPKLETEGEYDVNLIVLNTPIKSTGPVFINASEYDNVTKYFLNIVEEN